MTSCCNISLRNILLRIAQSINRNTLWLNGIKERLGLIRIAEKYLVKPLTPQEVQLIRASLRKDFIQRKVQSLKNIQRIHFYVFLVQSIGDIIANEPIARHLKTLAPTSAIHWIVNRNFVAILESNPNIDEIIPVNNFAEGEDICREFSRLPENIIIDCHFNGIAFDAKRKPHENPVNPKVNVYTHFYLGPLLSTFSLAAGLPPLNEAPVFYLRSGISRPNFKVSNYVVFHCRSNESAKDWKDSKWNHLAKTLTGEGYTVIEIGTKRVIGKNYNDKVINYTGEKDLQELATIVRDAQLFIGIDSAFSHMANCFKTPSVILLGKYKNFESYLPYSGPFPRSADFQIIRAPAGLHASHVDFGKVLAAARKKLSGSATY